MPTNKPACRISKQGAHVITDANVGDFLVQRHPGFAPAYTEHVERWRTEGSARYLLLRRFAEECMVPLLRNGSAEQRSAVFDTIERLIAEGDVLISDAVDHQVIDELVHVGHTLKDNPVDLTGAGPLTAEKIDRTRNWRPEIPQAVPTRTKVKAKTRKGKKCS